MLAPASHITGHLTNAAGTALQGISVQAYQLRNGNWQQVFSGGYASTDSAGDYNLSGLKAGTYRIGFRDGTASGNYVEEFWNDQPTVESAADIIVPASGTASGRDAVLAPAAHITGHLTNAAGSPLQGISVGAYQLRNGYWQQVFSGGYASTDAAGNYNLGGLKAGTYRIGFRDSTASGNYVEEFWNDQPTVESAADIIVSAGDTTGGKDAVLAPASHITGHVTNAAGTALQGISVGAYQLRNGNWQQVFSGGYASTDAAGNYNLGGLKAGTYRIGFRDSTASGNYVEEFWNDQTTVWSAADIIVSAGDTATGKDAVLAPAAHITGHLTNAAGTALQGISVQAYQLHDGYWGSVGFGSTDAAGNYNVGGLKAGTYRIGFRDNYATGNYLPEFWNDQPTVESAADIVVGAGGHRHRQGRRPGPRRPHHRPCQQRCGHRTPGHLRPGLPTARRILGVGRFRLDRRRGQLQRGWPQGRDLPDRVLGQLRHRQLPPRVLERPTDRRVRRGHRRRCRRTPPPARTPSSPPPPTSPVTSPTPPAPHSRASPSRPTNCTTEAGSRSATGGTPTARATTTSAASRAGPIGSDSRTTTATTSRSSGTTKPTVESATDIVVGAGGTVTGKDAVLAPAAHITGHLTNAAGTALQGISVQAYHLIDGSLDRGRLRGVHRQRGQLQRRWPQERDLPDRIRGLQRQLPRGVLERPTRPSSPPRTSSSVPTAPSAARAPSWPPPHTSPATSPTARASA